MHCNYVVRLPFSISAVCQMQDVRSTALRGGMTDAQRKETAAMMALKLFELMGGGDDEDEDDEAEES